MVAPLDDSAADCVADESEDCRSVVDFFVDRVSEASGLDLTVDRPAPTDVLGSVPETVDVDEPLDDSGPGSVGEDEFVAPDDVPVDPDDVPVDPVDPDDELADPDELEDPDEDPADELEDDCPPSSANADPMPQVPTKPATPSEKATAPTRNATLAEFISGPTPPPDR